VPIRFRKSFKLGSGVRVNLGKRSGSVSVSGRHVRVSQSTSGRRTRSVSGPRGSGLGYSTTRKPRCLALPVVAVAIAGLVGACQSPGAPNPTFASPTASPIPPTASSIPLESPDEDCIPSGLVGLYTRERTVDNTTESDLLGSWTLTIGPCDYQIAVDGIEQGGGRLELAEGNAEAGRLALSEDLGCPNEFTGDAFYDFTFDGSTLNLEEAIAGTDQCEGRAGAVAGPPAWLLED